jgi:hypothetical protein
MPRCWLRASVAAMTADRVGGGVVQCGSDDGDGGDSTMIGGVADFSTRSVRGPLHRNGRVAPICRWQHCDPMPLASWRSGSSGLKATPGREIYVWQEGQPSGGSDSVPGARGGRRG